jgi:uncharacterized membrane-anchored protein
MKKYIAFIVADVVLLAYTCYIRGSLTTQEKHMTEEERKHCLDVLSDAAKIANKVGPQIVGLADNRGATALTASAILMSAYAQSMGMTLHDAIGLFMLVHKQTIAMEREE